MNIIYKSLKEITPYSKNAKKHDKKQIANVAESLRQFGFVQPVVVDKDGIIVIGHCRVLAAKKLGMKEVPCVSVDDLTPEQVNALRIVDNKTNESEWDIGLLAAELPELDLSAFDFDFGMTEEEESIDIVEDEPPEPPTEPKSKRGDIWQLGNHRLMCGDSTDKNDIDALMRGQNDINKKANLLFTDPPYGYKYQSNARTEKFDVLENDDKILDFMPAIKNHVDGFVFICTTWKVLSKWLALFEKYYNLTNMIIWNKGGGGLGDLEKTFATDYEILLCSNNNKKITGKRLGSVWSIEKDDVNSYKHPTQKPVKLSAMAIENTTNENDIVLDCFGGSGSTLIACEQLNRDCMMMEYDPRYVDVIIQRWENFTGEKAVLLNGEER